MDGLLPHRRWLVPLATSCAVAAIAILPGALPHRETQPSLPDRSSDSILLMLVASRVNELSGTVVAKADLGLPELPAASNTVSTNSVASLLTGSHTVRVWQHGADQQRIAILDRLAETDLARSGSTVWSYQSISGAETLTTLDGLADSALVQTLLRFVILPIADGPDSIVSVGSPARIAGRDAYGLVIAPKRPGSLVDRVELAVDATQGTLLRVRVYAKDKSSPAFQYRFTSISYDEPDARLFAPVERPVPPRTVSPVLTAGSGEGSPGGGASAVSTIGFGWSAVVRLDAPDLAASAKTSLAAVTRPVPGGRALTTPLLSVLITDDSRLYVGAVPLDTLTAAASQ